MTYATSSVIMSMLTMHIFKYVFFIALIMVPLYILLRVIFPHKV